MYALFSFMVLISVNRSPSEMNFHALSPSYRTVRFTRSSWVTLFRAAYPPESDLCSLQDWNIIPSTIDILKYFANLPDFVIGGLSEVVDAPENTFMLNVKWHTAFDQFYWCLVPNGVVSIC